MPLTPKEFIEIPTQKPEVKFEKVVVPEETTAMNDRVGIFRLVALWINETLITDILNNKKGVVMNNDTKTTITGLVTGVVSLVALFGFNVSTEVVTAIISVGVLVLGYFTNKPNNAG